MNEILIKCLRCKTNWTPTSNDIKKTGEVYKTCNVCRKLRIKDKKICNCNYKTFCKECKKKIEYCEHNKPKSRCVICSYTKANISDIIMCIHEKTITECCQCKKSFYKNFKYMVNDFPIINNY